MNIPKHLVPFTDGDLVCYRQLHPPGEDEHYEIVDRLDTNAGFARSLQTAKFIVDSINLAYKISKIHGE